MKKISSIILALVMSLTCFAGLSTTAFAATTLNANNANFDVCVENGRVVGAVLSSYEGGAYDVVVPSTTKVEYYDDGVDDYVEKNLPVVAIGRYAFSHDCSLSKVTIPASVKTIGDDAFAWCESLTTVATSIANQNGVVNLPIAELGEEVFEYCTSITSVVVPGMIKEIPYGTFYDCTSLKSVVFQGNSVETIGDSAFSGCTSLTECNLKYGLKTIDDSAFYDCDSLINIVIPNSVVEIGEGAIRHCDSLKEATLSSSMTSISSFQFNSCDQLEKIVIPSSIRYISEYSFIYCINLKAVVYDGTINQWIGLGVKPDDIKHAVIYCADGNYHEEHVTTSSYTNTTCTENGYEIKTCVLCGYEERSVYVYATGHNWYTDYVYASESSDGYQYHRCLDCGANFTDNYVSAYGHNWVAYTYNASYTAKGYTLYQCQGCGACYTDAYKALKKITVPSVSKSAKSKSFTVKWKKNTKVSGYQIQYQKKGSKAVTKTVKGSATSFTAKKLKGNTNYTVKVRAYVKGYNENGKMVTRYSSWSKAVTIKTKR